jgi:hypothetical protein
MGNTPRSAVGIDEVHVDTAAGRYIDNGDGTVTHAETGLMITRAPWGMVWNGRRFEGEAILLPWRDAVRLFGCGSEVPYSVGGRGGDFGTEKLRASAFENGYTEGRCTVEFAGFDDWRLPTANELAQMSAWGGSGHSPIPEQLYPELAASKTKLWSATGLGSGLAWVFHGTFSDVETRHPMGVVFVRQGSKRLTREA